MPSSRIISNVYSYLLLAGILFAFINALDTTWLTATFNKNGGYPDSNVRNRIRFLVFSSWWTVVVTPLFIWKIDQLGVLVHGIFVLLTWSFSLTGAVLVTVSLKKYWTNELACMTHCGQLNAAAAFAWISCIIMTLVFLFAAYCLFIALTNGDILLGRVPAPRISHPSTATLPAYSPPQKTPLPSPAARTIHVPSPPGGGVTRQSIVAQTSPNLVASVAMLHPPKHMHFSPANSTLTATPVLTISPALTAASALTSTPTLAAIPITEERRQSVVPVTTTRSKRASWLERVFRRSGNEARNTATPALPIHSDYLKYISSDDLHSKY